MLPTIKLSSVENETKEPLRTEVLGERDLWENLSSNDITHLQNLFSANKTILEKENEKETWVTRAEFVDAISEVFGSNRFNSAASNVFNAALLSTASASTPSGSSSTPTLASAFTAFKTSIASSSSSSSSYNESNLSLPQGIGGAPSVEMEEKVTWGNILRQFMQFTNVREKEEILKEKYVFSPTPTYSPLPYNRSENIISVRVVQPYGHLFAVGNKGQIMMLDRRFQVLRKCQVILQDSDASSGEAEPWITCSSLIGGKFSIIGTVESVLHIVKDSKATGVYEVLKLVNLPDIPTALHSGIDGEDWWIAVGDDQGSIYMLKSTEPFEAFLKRADRKGTVSWADAFRKVGVVHLKDAHESSVADIVYHLQSDTLASCSKDPKAGLLVTRPYPSAQKYVFSISKGVRSMAVEWSLHVIATICGDGLVRTWNPFVTSTALMELPPSLKHDPPIDVGFVVHKAYLVILFIDSFIGIWSLESVNPLQTLLLKIPGGQKWTPISRPLTVTLSGGILVLGLHHMATLVCLDSTTDSCFSFKAETFSLSTTEGHESSKLNVDGKNEDREDSAFALTRSNLDLSSEVIPTSFDDKTKEKTKKLMKRGAPFCCLKLFKIEAPKLPKNLPLPKKLMALDLSFQDSTSFLSNLEQLKK